MQIAETLRQANVSLPDFATLLCASGLVLMCLLTALCGPLLAVSREMLYTVRRKVFLDKLALQIAQPVCGLAWLTALLLGGGAGAFVRLFRPDLLTPPALWALVGACAPAAAGLLLLSLYLASWNFLKKARFLHLPLGLLAAICLLGVLAGGYLALTGALENPAAVGPLFSEPFAALRPLGAHLVATPLHWLLLVWCLATGLAFCGSIGQLWLILRREKADYGRDYYVFAMHSAARSALFWTITALLAGGGAIWLSLRGASPEAAPLLLRALQPAAWTAGFPDPWIGGAVLAAALLPLICLGLWLAIIRSPTPLRHKPGVFIAWVLLLAALCGQLLVFGLAFS